MNEIETKRKERLNYLLAQIFGYEDNTEQMLADLMQITEPFEIKPEEAPKTINYPGFTGKRFTALQSKIDTENEALDVPTGI